MSTGRNNSLAIVLARVKDLASELISELNCRSFTSFVIFIDDVEWIVDRATVVERNVL